MEFFDALVRSEISPWSAVDHELSHQKQRLHVRLLEAGRGGAA